MTAPGTLAPVFGPAHAAWRWLLLGSEDGWGARLATGRSAIYLLALLAVVVHILDLTTGINMMLTHGIHLEQNPIARAIMESAGPSGLARAKLAVVVGGVVVFLWTARNGRVRLARNCLVFAVGSGVLGFASNLV